MLVKNQNRLIEFDFLVRNVAISLIIFAKKKIFVDFNIYINREKTFFF